MKAAYKSRTKKCRKPQKLAGKASVLPRRPFKVKRSKGHQTNQCCDGKCSYCRMAITSGGSRYFEKGRRKTIYQLRPHLSQMRTTKYMPFTRKKRLSEEQYEPIGGEGRPLNPPLATTGHQLKPFIFVQAFCFFYFLAIAYC